MGDQIKSLEQKISAQGTQISDLGEQIKSMEDNIGNMNKLLKTFMRQSIRDDDQSAVTSQSMPREKSPAVSEGRTANNSGNNNSSRNLTCNSKVEFPKFDGTNARTWIQKCERYFILCKIPAEQKVDMASLYMIGRAQEWVNSYLSIRKFVVWSDFIEALIGRFRDEFPKFEVSTIFAPKLFDESLKREKLEVEADEQFASVDASVQSDMELWPFKVVAVPSGDKQMSVVNYKSEEKQFAAEEISSTVLTGGEVISEECGSSLNKVTIDILGTTKKIIVSRNDKILLHGGGDKKQIEEICEELRVVMEKSTAMFDKEKAQERLSKLSGGVAVFKVGGASEAEVGERKDSVTDALNATRTVVEEGIVPVGGVATVSEMNFLIFDPGGGVFELATSDCNSLINMYSMLELWNLMDIPIEEQQMFQNVTCNVATSEQEIKESHMLSVDYINYVEEEVFRLEELKASKMKELVFKKRPELEAICRKALEVIYRKAHMIPESDSAMDTAIDAIETGVVDLDYIFEQIKLQIGHVDTLKEANVPWTGPCICHAIFIEGGNVLAAATAVFHGIDPRTSFLICEGLLFVILAWYIAACTGAHLSRAQGDEEKMLIWLINIS